MARIRTMGFEEALKKAQEMGYTMAEANGITTEIAEYLEEEPEEGTKDSGWFIMGSLLMNAKEAWKKDPEAYTLS
ncbi:MAG: hypothetical protein IJ899_12800 [Blautia sp.]|nr:hypothetical protein [Blautia sp.]